MYPIGLLQITKGQSSIARGGKTISAVQLAADFEVRHFDDMILPASPSFVAPCSKDPVGASTEIFISTSQKLDLLTGSAHLFARNAPPAGHVKGIASNSCSS